MHQHKCGFGMGGFLGFMHGEPSSAGCGHVWEHADKMPGEPISDVPHYCPRCGVGPWVLHYVPRTCEVKGIPYEVPAFVGQDDPAFQQACYAAAHAGVYR